MNDTVHLTASYAALTEAFVMRRDAEAKELLAAYGARPRGAWTDNVPEIPRRYLMWELSQNRGERAAAELEGMGFATELRVLA